MAKIPNRRFAQFLKQESAGGIVLLVAAAFALIAANSVFVSCYDTLIHFPIGLAVGKVGFTVPLAEWVKDILMVGFFLMVGMELKREMREGVLTDRRQILLPLVAALGGMVVPALFFLAINRGLQQNMAGWAIPTATDIAFALAVLLLTAKNLPPSLKIFLLAIAIFDDLGAILIIAFFYSGGIALIPLLAAIALALLLGLMNHRGVTRLMPYLSCGILLSAALYHTGIHTTIGGVITGLAIPLRGSTPSSRSPLDRCLQALHPWVSFGILPLFAFTTAGMPLGNISVEMLVTPLTLGITGGLLLGKPLGIFGASWAMIRLGGASLPPGTRWNHLIAVSMLAGIGFTLSLFIASLAFASAELRDAAKLGVFAGSLLAALGGGIMLRAVAR